MFTNKELFSYIVILVTFFLSTQIINSILIYYFNYVTESKGLFQLYNGVGFVEIIGLLIFPKIAKWLSREKVFPLATFFVVVGLLILLGSGYIAPKNAILVVIGTAFIKMGSGFIMGIITVSIADVIDYSEVKFGQRNESVITSTQTFLMKTAMALSGLITGWGLSLFNYQPGEPQSDFTKTGIRIIMCVFPIIFVLISYLVYRFSYNLKGAFLKDIVNILNNRKKEKMSDDKN